MDFTVGGRAECDIDCTSSWQNVTITAVDEAGGTYSVVSDLGIFVGAVPAVQVRAQAAARLATPNEDDGVLGAISEALGVIEAGGSPAKQAGGAQGGGGGDGDDADGAEPTPQNPKSSKKKKSHKQPSTKKSRMAVVEDSDDPVAPLSMDPRMRNADFRSDPGAEGLSRRGGGFDTVAAQQQQQQQLQQPRGLASKGAFGESPSYGTVSMDDFDDIDPNMRPKDLCGDLSCTIA